MAEGATISVGGAQFTISYVGGDGNDVVLTAANSVVAWDAGGNGTSWNDSLNWAGDTLPQNGDAILISGFGESDIVFDAATIDVAGISSDANLQINTNELTISGDSTLANVTIAGGTLHANAALSTGQFALQSGTLSINSATSISDSPMDVSGGTIVSTDASAVIFGNWMNLSGDLTVAGTNDIVLSGQLNGTGGLIKNGSGLLQLTNNGTYSGLTTINDGSLLITNVGQLGSTAAGTIVNGGATLALGEAVTNADSVTLSGIGATLHAENTNVSTQAGNITLAATDTAVISSNERLLISGQIAGTVSGNAELVFDGLDENSVVQLQPTVDNTFTATVLVNDGALQTLTSDVIAITGDIEVGDSDTTRAFLSLARPNTLTATSNVILNSDAYLDLDTRNVGNAFAVNQTINNLTVTGTGLAAPVQTASQIDTTSTQHAFVGLLTVAGTYRQLAGSETTEINGNLALTQTSTNNFEVDGGGTASPSVRFTANSAVVDGATGSKFNVTGLGDVEFLGTSSPQFQTDIHTDFHLGASGNITTSTRVFGGGKLTGIGTTNFLTVHPGGTVAPGNSPGVINSGNFNLNSTGVLEIEVGGTGGLPNAGVTYDQINVTGTVTLAGTLDLYMIDNVSTGQQYTIINNDGADAVSGTFDGLTEGATISTGPATYTISYAGGDGNDVVLTANTTTGLRLWDGGGDGTSWEDALNWVGDTVPGTQAVYISVPGNQTIVSTGTVLVNSITSDERISITGGTFADQSNSFFNNGISITGGSYTPATTAFLNGETSSITGGTVAGSGIIQNDGDLIVGGGATLNATLENFGTITQTGDLNVLTGTISNNVGATYTLHAGVALIDTVPQPGSFINQGIINTATTAGTGIATFQIPFTNIEGEMSPVSGVALQFGDGGTFEGTLTGNGSGFITFSDGVYGVDANKTARFQVGGNGIQMNTGTLSIDAFGTLVNAGILKFINPGPS